MLAWPTDQIDQTIKPTAAQRSQLQLLQSAVAQAAEIIKAACPSEAPSTNRLISVMMMVREPLAKGIDAPISTAMRHGGLADA